MRELNIIEKSESGMKIIHFNNSMAIFRFYINLTIFELTISGKAGIFLLLRFLGSVLRTPLEMKINYYKIRNLLNKSN